MSRPLLITDCDEVLLHMVSHFRDWLDERHDVMFNVEHGEFAGALTRRGDGAALAGEQVWPLLNGFFKTEMPRQTIVPGAREALHEIGAIADIVILTNLIDDHRERRSLQLANLGINHRVVTNQGGKGTPVRALIEEIDPSVTVFVDDLAQHHASVAARAPDVWRVHMIAEPLLARRMAKAPDAHVRIDDWPAASAWILDRMAGKPL